MLIDQVTCFLWCPGDSSDLGHQRSQRPNQTNQSNNQPKHTCIKWICITECMSRKSETLKYPMSLIVVRKHKTVGQRAYLAGLRASCASLTLALASSSSLSSAGIADLLASAALRISSCLRSRLEAFSASSLACNCERKVVYNQRVRSRSECATRSSKSNVNHTSRFFEAAISAVSVVLLVCTLTLQASCLASSVSCSAWSHSESFAGPHYRGKGNSAKLACLRGKVINQAEKLTEAPSAGWPAQSNI